MAIIEITDELPALTGDLNRHYALRVEAMEKFEPYRAHFSAAFDSVSPTQRIALYAEVLWAAVKGADLAQEDKVLVGRLAHFCAANSLFGFQQEGRGFKMLGAMRRELNEPDANQPEDQDPEPLAAYVAPPE